MKKKKDIHIEDDGRTVANMNVDGMPWYSEKTKKQKNNVAELTDKEKRAFTKGVLKATLLITTVYAVVFLIFILFCVYIWFR